MTETLPRVSVITATYNRSNTLRYAIESVRASTLSDWEHIIVGDCCTDDTEQVVASFREPRIRFTNLPTNIGEQSGPNNVGCTMARGRYIAFLNHDDLFLPHHLETAVSTLEQEGADLVYALGLRLSRKRIPHLLGAAPQGKYGPHMRVPASLWLFRRELLQAIGEWRFYREIHNVPSQDWLTRVWQDGKKIRMIPRIGVVVIPSGGRKNVYANREDHEQAAVWERIQRGDKFEPELAQIAREMTVRAEGTDLRVFELIQRATLNVYYRACYTFGRSPVELNYWVQFGRKGAYIDRLRRHRGLPPKER